MATTRVSERIKGHLSGEPRKKRGFDVVVAPRKDDPEHPVCLQIYDARGLCREVVRISADGAAVLGNKLANAARGGHPDTRHLGNDPDFRALVDAQIARGYDYRSAHARATGIREQQQKGSA